MVDVTDYNVDAVNAARSVLLELSHLLSAYRKGIVIIGGWVPELLYDPSASEHVGSLDVDLALDHNQFQEAGYRTIRQLLLTHGYEESEQPFTFFRRLQSSRGEVIVQVDFLAGEYGGTGKKRRTQAVQDMHPRKARGCDLAFDLPVEITLSGSLPDGSLDNVPIRVASIVPFIIMKAMAITSRLKEKDAYDIYYCLTHYPEGLDRIVEEFNPFLNHGLVREGLEILADKFASPDHFGPRSVVDFEMVTDQEERARIQRDVFERVNYLLSNTNIT